MKMHLSDFGSGSSPGKRALFYGPGLVNRIITHTQSSSSDANSTKDTDSSFS